MPKRELTEKNSVPVTCGWCECDFKILRLRFNERKKRDPERQFYCSKDCLELSRSGRVSKGKTKAALAKGSRLVLNCFTCGSSFERIKSDTKEINFCSLECWSKVSGIFKSCKTLPDAFDKWIKDVKIPLDQEKDCWIWIGKLDTWDDDYRHKNGHYGVFIWPGRRGVGRPIGAHIASYKLFTGDENTKGFQICHTCDNPPCVNPFHLFKGTNKDNQQDCKAKGRKPTGPQAYKARFTESQIIELRRMYVTGEYTYTQLGYLFGVNPSTVSKAVRGKSYFNVA